jgi:hypothetical protein
MIRKICLRLNLFAILIIGSAQAYDDPAEHCGTQDPVTATFLNADTVRCVVLFCWSSSDYPNSGMDEMKPWMYNMWNESYEDCITHFYIYDVS